MLETFKGRTLEEGQRVKVYYNLHTHKFSIQDYKTGLVLGHSEVVRLTDCNFKVSKAGRERVLREKRKNVHAFVIGCYAGTEQGNEVKPAMYNPYKYESFIGVDGNALYAVESVTCINKQVRYR